MVLCQLTIFNEGTKMLVNNQNTTNSNIDLHINGIKIPRKLGNELRRKLNTSLNSTEKIQIS